MFDNSLCRAWKRLQGHLRANGDGLRDEKNGEGTADKVGDAAVRLSQWKA